MSRSKRAGPLRSVLTPQQSRAAIKKKKLRQKAVNQAKRKQVANKVDLSDKRTPAAASQSQQSICAAQVVSVVREGFPLLLSDRFKVGVMK